MNIKKLVIITLLQAVVLCCGAQNIDDLLMRENDNANTTDAQSEAVTMAVDRDVAPGKGPGLFPEEKPDSLSLINEKWQTYLLNKNDEIQQISNAIQQKETGKVKKEEIEDFILQINTLKKDFNNRKETNGLWQANDELDELRNKFDFACEKELNKLSQWKETRVKKSIPSMYIIMIVILLVVMIGLPIFNLVKGSVMAKKAKKLQALQAKVQRDKAETERLLSDDANIITLTRKL